jgi:colicin import membrane protein
MLRAAEEEAEARRREQFAREQQRLIEEKRQAARADAQRMAEDARQQRLELDRQAEERRSAEAERLTREVEEQARAEEQRLAEQRRVAEAKRKAEEARIAEIKRQAEEAAAKQRIEEARVAELKRQAAEAETKRAAEAARVAEQQRIEATKAAQRTAQEAQREAEAARIAEKFRLARKAREERSRTTSAPDMETRNSLGGPVAEPARPAPLLAAPAATPMSYPQRVTVLIVMQPRRHGFAGKRMTANPVLCVGDSCYVSNGPTSPATVMRRAQALGPGNTLGRNAGVCRNQTTCVFRGVTLSTPQTTMQPVDMGFLRHDRREIRSIEPDRSCDAGADGLSCSTPIISSGYRAWVVPETIAERVGAPALARALDDGLPAARSASAEGWGTLVQTLPTR